MDRNYEKNLAVNFCPHCGKKINPVCNCWVKKEPFNCGQEKCPGYGLYALLRDSDKLNG